MARHAEIAALLPRLRRTASSLGARSAALEAEDLLQEAALSALEAAERVDTAGLSDAHARSVLYMRAVGGMRDAVRRDDPTSRAVYDRRRTLQDAEQHLQLRLGRTPSDPELAAHLHLSLTQLWSMRAAATPRYTLSMDAPLANDEEHSALGELLTDAEQVLPEEAASHTLLLERVRSAIAVLPERQQQIVQMLYGEDRTLAETGAALGVSPSRVSQLHSAIRASLRTLLAEEADRAVA